jgi:hypothetical protein
MGPPKESCTIGFQDNPLKKNPKQTPLKSRFYEESQLTHRTRTEGVLTIDKKTKTKIPTKRYTVKKPKAAIQRVQALYACI